MLVPISRISPPNGFTLPVKTCSDFLSVIGGAPYPRHFFLCYLWGHFKKWGCQTSFFEMPTFAWMQQQKQTFRMYSSNALQKNS
jgi:hypothetical protein